MALSAEEPAGGRAFCFLAWRPAGGRARRFFVLSLLLSLSSSSLPSSLESGSSTPPFRTEQEAAKSRHLQLLQQLPKWPLSRTQMGKGLAHPRPASAAIAARHRWQGRCTCTPLEWIKRALMYDGRCDCTCAAVILSRRTTMDRPGRANTARDCCEVTKPASSCPPMGSRSSGRLF
jgi:hypothetical protein